MRRRYIVEVDVDDVPGWNDRDRPEDMARTITEALGEWYHPTVTYDGPVEEA